MSRKIAVIVALCTLATSPAVADIVDVSVNGSVSGSGSITVACALSTPGCREVAPGTYLLTNSYSFSATNTALGSFGDSGSATGAPSFPPAFVSSYAGQDTSATSDALEIMLTGGHSAMFAPSYMTSETDTISVSFDPTKPSMIELSGGGFGIGPDVGELLDSEGDVILTLPNSPLPVFGDLGPGTYELQAAASATESGAFAEDVNSLDFVLGLDGSVTQSLNRGARSSPRYASAYLPPASFLATAAHKFLPRLTQAGKSVLGCEQ